MSSLIPTFPASGRAPMAVPAAAFEVLGYLCVVAVGTLCFLLRWLTPDGAGVLTVVLLSFLIVLTWKRFDQGQHPCFLFLCMLLFFQGGGLLAYCLGANNDPLRVQTMTPNPFYVSRDAIGIVLLSLALSAICIYAPCRWNYQKLPRPGYAEVRRYLPYLYLVFYFSIPFQAFKNYRYFDYAQQHGGYLAIYLNYAGLASSAPSFVRAISLITLPAFVAIFVFESRKKFLFLTTAVYFVTASLILLMGARLAVFGLILALWYVARMKSTRRSRIFVLAVSVFALTIAADIVEQNREDPDSSLNYEFLPLKFLAVEGVSLNVTEVAVQYKEIFRPHVGGYLLFDLESAVVVGDQGNYSPGKSLDYDISVLLNPELFASGHGVGSSYVAEAYLIGGIGAVVAISLLIGFGLNLAYRFSKNAPSLFVVALVLPAVLVMPRSGLLNWVSAAVRSAILIALLGLGWQLYSLLTSIRRQTLSDASTVGAAVVR
jgi:oligosaccharide repeat unit polymerase